MLIKLIGTTGISILSIAVVVAMSSGIAQNSEAIIDMALSMFWGLLWAIVAVTALINLPKILKALV